MDTTDIDMHEAIILEASNKDAKEGDNIRRCEWYPPKINWVCDV